MKQEQSDIPRETFIALRARRQAFRIATDLLYHDTPTDAPPHPLSYRPRRWPLRPNYISGGAVVLLTMMAMCVIACVAMAIAEGLIQLPTRLR